MTVIRCISDYPELMKDWAQELNPGVDPAKITAGSKKYIVWRCNKCGRTWRAQVCNRVNGTGCICDAQLRRVEKNRKRLVERDGSLAQTRPDIAAQWHPELNGTLSPDDITEKSTYKAWWIGDDGVPWQSVVAVRCRSLQGTHRPKDLVVPGFNDLKTLRPDLAVQWNYEKNTNVSIDAVMPGTKRKVWWICEKGHEWQTSVISRAYSNHNCPECNKERNTSFPEQAIFYYLRKTFPDAINRYNPERNVEVDIYIPSKKIAVEYDGEYYHQSEKKRKMDSRKNIRLHELGITLIRVIEGNGDIPKGTEYSIICKRVNSVAIIDDAIEKLFKLISNLVSETIEVSIDSERDRIAIFEQFLSSAKQNSIATVAPQLLAEWHPKKNGKIVPEYINAMSNKVFWWKCCKCGHEWESPVYRRTRGNGCPACSGNTIVIGINDLLSRYPKVAAEWDYEENSGLTPDKVLPGSNIRYWWKCKACGYKWQAAPCNRVRGTGCPSCAGLIVTSDRSLKALYPDIALQWCYERNGELTPEQVLPHSDKKVWWICKNGHIWDVSISRRTAGSGCPYCANQKVMSGYNDLSTMHPELLSEWDYQRNSVSPSEIYGESTKRVYWKCSSGHSWEISIYNRVKGSKCPYCTNRKVIPGENDLESACPTLMFEWSFEKNTTMRPNEVTAGSNKKAWWKCSKCGYEWEASIWSRVRGRGCPACAKKT